MKKLRYFIIVLLLVLIGIFFFRPKEAMIQYSNVWGSQIVNPISTAINVYTKGDSQGVIQYEGEYENVTYEVIEVRPDENTKIQLDYAGEIPITLDQLYDEQTIQEGWTRVGGINAGFFNRNQPDYGYPTGAVLVQSEWKGWGSEMLTPAYGRGNVTVYFNHYGGFDIHYHGWQNGQWMPSTDTFWYYNTQTNSYQYDIQYEYGVSGAYSLLKNGKRVWLGKTHSMYWERSKTSPVTLFGQKEDGTYLLVIAQNIGGGEKETALMQSLGAYHAIRLDGNSSTSMVILREYQK